MTDILFLPPSAWRAGPGHAVAAFAMPRAGAVAIRAEGWAEPATARLLPDEGAPIAFLSLQDAAFATAIVTRGTAFTIEAPSPPLRCRIVLTPSAGVSPTLALLAPRAIRSPARRAAYDLDAGRRRVDAALAAQDLDTALAVVAEMLVAARGAAATQAAVAGVLAHLARHPLCRSASLGAFVAALTE
jgi:hypothetical protein